MVFCIVFGCGNRSERDRGGPYCTIPTVRLREGEEERQRSEERRRLWLKAIARAYLTDSKVKYERVCWRHFVSGKDWRLSRKHVIILASVDSHVGLPITNCNPNLNRKT